MIDMRKILFVGDSHIHSVQTALKKTPDTLDGFDVKALRLTVKRNGSLIGDIKIEDLKLACAKLGPDDFIVSMVGGNQHSILSLIQHSQPFDVSSQSGEVPNLTQPNGAKSELIPRNTLKAVFDRSNRANDGKRILDIAAAGLQRTIHLSSPPPKHDIAHIQNATKQGTFFATKGLHEKGISPAALRQRIWGIQNESLEMILTESGVGFLPPPDGTMQDDGCLEKSYYAKDATHANGKYGEKILEQVFSFAGSSE